MASTLPILALDVDGPIALMGNPEPGEVFERTVDEVPLLISRRLPERLRRLSQAFRIVWSSSWGRRASARIGPLVGLPEGLPFIPFSGGRRPGRSYKLPGLRRWLKNWPAAVVDDEVGTDMWEWAAARPDTLIIQVDPRLGLVDSEVEKLLAFAALFLEGLGGVGGWWRGFSRWAGMRGPRRERPGRNWGRMCPDDDPFGCGLQGALLGRESPQDPGGDFFNSGPDGFG